MFIFNEYLSSQDEHLKIKDFVDNNIDITEYAFAPIIDYFDLCKKYYRHYYCQCYYYHGNIHREFYEKIIKSYFNIEYIKFFYLLQQSLVLQNVAKYICNVNTLIDIFMNLYYNSSIDCNEKNKNKLYDLYNTILLNKFVHGDIKK